MAEKNVVLGITGGIAVYKVPDLVSRLRKKGFNVDVIMTKSATEFVTPLTFREVSRNPVHTEMFANPVQWNVAHIALAKKADLIAIVPATANIIAKLATGIADDLLTATLLAARCPKLIAPAMNSGMYNNPACQRNLKQLADDGFVIVGPDSGHLLCGDEGVGRLASLDEIEINIQKLLSTQDFINETVLITAGGTREAIDPVRFIGNRSSGKMGHALAEAAFKRGAKVILISTSPDAPRYAGMEVYGVESTAQMRDQVLSLASRATIIIKAAAPADFRPASVAQGKIKKTSAGMDLSLVINPDILLELGRNKRSGQILIGFAAETDSLSKNARDKLERKNLDLIVGNRVADAMGTECNKVTVFSKTNAIDLLESPKPIVADQILDLVIKYRMDGTLSE